MPNTIGLSQAGQQLRVENLTNSHTANTAMTDHQLEHYMCLVASKIDQVGEHYVNRQVAWAEEQLRLRGVV